MLPVFKTVLLPAFVLPSASRDLAALAAGFVVDLAQFRLDFVRFLRLGVLSSRLIFTRGIILQLSAQLLQALLLLPNHSCCRRHGAEADAATFFLSPRSRAELTLPVIPLSPSKTRGPRTRGNLVP